VGVGVVDAKEKSAVMLRGVCIVSETYSLFFVHHESCGATLLSLHISYEDIGDKEQSRRVHLGFDLV
jgi:hypothetical protein